MAVTSNTYTVGGSGQAGPYSYSFPILADADVSVSVNGSQDRYLRLHLRFI